MRPVRECSICYKDNAAVIGGHKADWFCPISMIRNTEFHDEIHTMMKVETHNHLPISPYPGAATGSGGVRMKQQQAGAMPKAGLTGLVFRTYLYQGIFNLGKRQSSKPDHIASTLDIILDGPIGGATYNNEFGRPNILGYFRTFEEKIRKNRILLGVFISPS